MSILTEIKEHLRSNRAAYIVGALAALIASLFLVIWQHWLYEALAQQGQAVPRRVLGALIGILLILLLASIALVILYARELTTLKRSRPRLKAITLESNDVLILQAISISERRYEEPVVIARTTGLDLTLTEFHLHRLCEAGYLYCSQGFYSLLQKARQYLIDNKKLVQ